VTTIPLTPEFMESLREAHETYRHLVEGIPAALYIDAVDDLSTNVYTSPQIEEIVGISADEWREDPSMWIVRLHADDRERVLAEHKESNRTGEPFSSEYRLIRSDGREVWIRDEAVLVRDEDGKPLYWRGIMYDVTDRRRTEERLRRSLEILRRTMEDRRRLLMRLEGAQEEERRRIASDIHDDSIQVISAADLRAQTLARHLEDPEHRRQAEELRDTLHEAVIRLRHLLFELRPPSLDREGLVPALRSYVDGLEGTPIDVESELASEPPADIRALLFRIAQEAITNARKHASASRIVVTLSSAEGGVRLRVSDDGVGFVPPRGAEPVPGHIGVPTMIERAELAGGRCRIESKPGRGTTVDAWLPLGPAVSATQPTTQPS
jgi:PAS domain S-box-containing protein